MSAARDRDELIRVGNEIAALTGEEFYLYTSAPGDGQTRVVFADSTVKQGYRAGLAHAERVLAYLQTNGVQEGWKYEASRFGQ